jgi:hypothetical protein
LDFILSKVKIKEKEMTSDEFVAMITKETKENN